jgi:hypothetical protein
MSTEPRKQINGHHPDCPYGYLARPVAHCNVCQGIRKGADPDYRWDAAPTDHPSHQCDRCRTQPERTP